MIRTSLLRTCSSAVRDIGLRGTLAMALSFLSGTAITWAQQNKAAPGTDGSDRAWGNPSGQLCMEVYDEIGGALIGCQGDCTSCPEAPGDYRKKKPVVGSRGWFKAEEGSALVYTEHHICFFGEEQYACSPRPETLESKYEDSH
jgi:hypothetical protein